MNKDNIMSDHTLIELAAKAAGIRTFGAIEAGGSVGAWVKDVDKVGEYYVWRPFDSNDHAFRLLVLLKIDLNLTKEISPMHKSARVTAWSDDETRSDEFMTGNEEKAVRRAIVRAAAEIGKNLHEA